MFTFLASLISWVFGFWQQLPDSVTSEIIDFIVNYYVDNFRTYYRNYKNQE